MNRSVLQAGIGGWLCAAALLCSATVRGDVAATRPALEKESGISPRATVAAAPNHSPLDVQEIHRTDSGIPSSQHPTSLPSLGLPRIAGALAVVLGLIFALRWGAKKLFIQSGARKSVRAVQVLARSPVSPRQNIMLLRVGRRVIVVGDSGTQMNPLSEITDADEIAALLGQLQEDQAHLPTKAFGAMVRRFRSDMGTTDEQLLQEQEERDVEASGESAEQPAEDPSISDTREEITGLMDKIRVLSKHFRGGPA